MLASRLLELLMVVATLPPGVADGVAKNAAMHAKIESIHVKVNYYMEKPNEPQRVMRTSESWRSGLKERSFTRTPHPEHKPNVVKDEARKQGKAADQGKGQADQESKEKITILGFNDREVRNLSGWNPEHPYRLPLEWGINAKEFGLVHCSLGPRDPRAGASDWSGILLDPDVGTSLSDLLNSSEVTLLPSDHPGRIRFKLKSCPIPGWVGYVLELDPEHGYGICRLEGTQGGASVVEGYREFADGVWVPARVRRTLGKVATVADVVECEVNVPFSEGQLAVEFPQGAAVVEPARGKWHIWGTSAPAKTFTAHKLMMDYVYERAREIQSQPNQGAGVAARRTFWQLGFFWINLVLVTLLLVLFFLKRTYFSAKGSR